MENMTQEAPKYTVDENVVREKIESLKLEQSMAGGIAGGVIGGLIGAALWAVITYLSEFQIGWMSVGVGFLVGYGVRLLGKGIDKSFGVVGGVIAFLAVALGNFLAALGFLAKIFEFASWKWFCRSITG